jgi:hypothetical protein
MNADIDDIEDYAIYGPKPEELNANILTEAELEAAMEQNRKAAF